MKKLEKIGRMLDGPEMARARLGISAALIACGLLLPSLRAQDLEKVFLDPPASARPRVLWMWMGSNITQEGITRDLDSLKAATLHGSKVLQMESEIGSLDPGKMADFVVLDRNPLEDIRAVRSICQVVRGGKVYPRDELDRYVPECASFAPGW